jgi:hypothetical protein
MLFEALDAINQVMGFIMVESKSFRFRNILVQESSLTFPVSTLLSSSPLPNFISTATTRLSTSTPPEAQQDRAINACLLE